MITEQPIEKQVLPYQRESTVPGLLVNFDRAEVIWAGGKQYRRLCIKTPLFMPGDDLLAAVEKYAFPFLRDGDTLVLTEKIVAITQGRALPVKEVRPGSLARFLSHFVTKTTYGIGLSMPETMECAIRECGYPRILLAAAVGALGKLLGKKGWFYRVAGIKAAGIDGPCACTIPPYNQWIVLSPDEPCAVAVRLSDAFSDIAAVRVVIADCNDLGGELIGWTEGVDVPLVREALRDNPLGQGDDQTPMLILRRAE